VVLFADPRAGHHVGDGGLPGQIVRRLLMRFEASLVGIDLIERKARRIFVMRRTSKRTLPGSLRVAWALARVAAIKSLTRSAMT
jgi:hypothetical protein